MACLVARCHYYWPPLPVIWQCTCILLVSMRMYFLLQLSALIRSSIQKFSADVNRLRDDLATATGQRKLYPCSAEWNHSSVNIDLLRVTTFSGISRVVLRGLSKSRKFKWLVKVGASKGVPPDLNKNHGRGGVPGNQKKNLDKPLTSCMVLVSACKSVCYLYTV